MVGGGFRLPQPCAADGRNAVKVIRFTRSVAPIAQTTREGGKPMKLSNHRLIEDDGSPIKFHETPNHGGSLKPELLVVHFTAGRGVNNTVSWLMNPAAKASAHVVIGEDGTIVQLVPFNVVAWHAGISEWNGRKRVNDFSIGIELSNPGNLKRTGTKWRTWYGDIVEDDLVMVAPHPHGGREQGWKVYPTEQLDAAIELGTLLQQTYGFRDVVGHEDVAPGRKFDPGPAFPLERYRALLLGRADDPAA